MIIAARKLRQIYLLSLYLAVLLFGGCGSLPTSRVPMAYSHVATISVAGDAGEPFGIHVDDDIVYVCDGENGTIRKGNVEGNWTTVASGLNTPSAIAVLPDGNLLVADTGSHTIRKVSSEGQVTILAGVENTRGMADGPVLGATFNAPVGVAIAGDGTIYVSDTYNDRIRVIRDGVVSTIAGSERGFADGVGSSAMFDTPLGLAMWGDSLLIADSGNGRIRLLDSSGVVHTLAGSDRRDLVDGTLSS